jgi:hypothetical protein
MPVPDYYLGGGTILGHDETGRFFSLVILFCGVTYFSALCAI